LIKSANSLTVVLYVKTVIRIIKGSWSFWLVLSQRIIRVDMYYPMDNTLQLVMILRLS